MVRLEYKHQLSRALKTGSGWNDTCDETASTTARLPSCQTPSTGLRHPSFLPLEEGAGKRSSECVQLCHSLTFTFRVSLSGTFLQTLPELVTPLNGALFISAQLSTEAVSALRKVWVLIRLWKHHSVKART